LPRLSSRSNSIIILQRLLMVTVLAVIFLVSASVVMYFALRGREVAVPNVVGKSQREAESLLEDQGLKMRVRNRAHHDKIPVEAVSEQSPAPGTTVKTGQVVRVSLSLGAPPPEKEAGSR
jgi:beta-lactam-binding protein with PASTA domain